MIGAIASPFHIFETVRIIYILRTIKPCIYNGFSFGWKIYELFTFTNTNTLQHGMEKEVRNG